MPTAKREQHPKSSPQIRLKLTDITYQGAGLGRDAEGRVLFADYGIPGEEVIVEIERQKRNFSQGRVVNVLTPAESRVEPPCPYFGSCGGCQWQHIAYDQQIRFKQQILREQLRRIGNFDDPPVSATVPAPEPYGFRNNARFHTDRNGNLGFIRRALDDADFIQIERCLIMQPEINEMLHQVQGCGKGQKQVVIRCGEHTGDGLIEPDLARQASEIESGQPHYVETLLGQEFQISVGSFFQTNTRQAEQLVMMVRDRLQLSGCELVVDAFAGVGTFAVLLAPLARRIIAIEQAASAIEDAAINTAGLDNIDYHHGKVEDILGSLDIEPDAIILDPPRAGCDQYVLDTILHLRPANVVYVSCHPSTLARDLHTLVDGGYTLRDVTPVDMFPQTAHIESVSTLELA